MSRTETASNAVLIKGEWHIRRPQKPNRIAVAADTLTDYACWLIRHQRACFLLNTYAYRNHPLGRHWHRFMTWVYRAGSEWTEWEAIE